MLNGALINVSNEIIAPPAGFDLKTAEGLQAAMPHMGPEHFLFPFTFPKKPTICLFNDGRNSFPLGWSFDGDHAA